MELGTVFRLHSAFAATCGTLAVALPSFFGSVFPSMASPDTLAFIVRVYAVLLTAQAPLLYGIRQLHGPALRPFATVYALIFGATAAVCAHSDFVLGVVREENKDFLWVWLGLCAVYIAFAAVPALQKVFRPWSLVHMVSVTAIGVTAIAAPASCNVRYFLVPNEDAYNTVSRYYGVLILGMSLLAAASTSAAARPAWPAVRGGLCAMFAASGACLALYLAARREQLEPVGIGSLLTFAAMAALYGTARLPASPGAAAAKAL